MGRTTNRSSVVLPGLFLILFRANRAAGYFLSSSNGQAALTFNVAHPDPMAHAMGAPAKENVKEMSKKQESEKQDLEKTYRHDDSSHKYPFINSCHVRLEAVFGKLTDHWYYDWKLWIGSSLWLGVWANWLLYGYDPSREIYYQRSLFAFGINAVILHHLQFAESIKLGMIVVCCVLGGQAIFQSLFMMKNEVKDLDLKEEEVQAELSKTCTFPCETLYLDLSLPFEQIVVLFLAQCAVWWFYMTSIVHNFDFLHVNYMFWLVAYMAMQLTMIYGRGDESVLGKPFPCHEVYRLVMQSGRIKVKEEGTVGTKPFTVSKVDLCLRGIMGFWVNGICREIMAYTIPLMLMGFDEPMDFVVYCVGVNFICTLDDVQSKKFGLKVTHAVEVGDEVVAKWPDYRGTPNEHVWFAGTVTKVDPEQKICSITYTDGSFREQVSGDDVYYAPSRDSEWGQTEKLRGDDLIPNGASPITFKRSMKSDDSMDGMASVGSAFSH